MIEMENGDTVIKVMDVRVGEMVRKGWKIKGEIETVEVALITEEDTEAEEDGDTHGE